jgi:hypothetical protein
MKPMTAVFGAVVVSAVLLFSAEPKYQREAVHLIDRYAGNNYPPLTEWAAHNERETKSKAEFPDTKTGSGRD